MDQSGTPPPEALPKWLTEDYFRSLFRRKSPGEEVAVQNVTVSFAHEERVDGKLIRAAVDVATPSGAQTLSYVVKRPGPGPLASTPACANMYRMEALVLGEVVPAMEKVLDAVAPGKFGQLAPRLVDCGLDGDLFVMTEDLSAQGFRACDRRTGLDLEQSLAYAQHLAAFHAASVAVMDRYESEIRAIPLMIDSEEVQFLNEFIADSMRGVASAIDAWDEGPKFAERVRQLGASLPSRLAQANRAREGLGVLCHGDMFVNNILFRGGEGGVAATAVRLVDFQLSRVGSFADDLAGSLVSAAGDDVLRHHWERVGERYRETLNAALLAVGHGARALSQEAVRDALRAQRAVAQFALFHMLPRARAPADVRAAEAFQAPAYLALLRLLLPRFRALGWLDESHSTTGNVETRTPSWLERNDYKWLLLQLPTLARLQFQRDHVTAPEGGPASTTDVLQATVDASFPSGVETQFFRVRCPGNVELYKMPAQSCTLEMDTRALGKLIPIAEEIAEGVVPGTISSQARALLDRGKNSRSYVRKRSQIKPILHQKSSDLKFCLAVLRHLVLFHAASMIALEQNSTVSNIAIVSSSPVLKEYITSVKTILSRLTSRQVEKTGNENAPDERVRLDSDDAPVKGNENQLDHQKSTVELVEQSDENEIISHPQVSNEHFEPNSNNTSVNCRLHEQREQEVAEISNIGHKVKKIACANHISKPSYPAERVVTRVSTTELSDSFKTLSQNSKTRPGVLPSNNQERREDLASRLDVHLPVDQITFLRVPPQAAFSEKADSARLPFPVQLFELPHLRHCGLSERLLPRFNTNFGHILHT